MSIYSMTGYGKSGNKNDAFDITLEIRTVNNRFADYSIKLPREMASFEFWIKEQLQARIRRGKVYVYIDLKEIVSEDTDPVIDEAKILRYYRTLQKAEKIIQSDRQVNIDHLLNFPEIFERNTVSADESDMKKLLKPALDQALSMCIKMREQEGDHLSADIRGRIKLIAALGDEVKMLAKDSARSEFNKLLKNVTDLIGEQKLDKDRLEQEIAIIADRVDITEELVRLASHVKLFTETLEKGGEVGKKLNFILQEMLREANTINSKTTNLEISHKIIRIKQEIEKIREQAQNLE